MTRVLAAVDAGPLTAAVTGMAEALVPILADRLELATVGPEADLVAATANHPVVVLSGAVGEALAEEATSADVVAVVIGLRSVSGGPRPAGHVTRWLITHCEMPVVVVPPEAAAVTSPDPLHRVLLPLEGGDAPGSGTKAIITALERRGSVIDPVHIFDRASAPLFWDRWHDPDLYAGQFTRQFSPVPAPTELRSGAVAQQIIEAAAEHGSSLIVLEWKRELSGSHAPVIRELLSGTPIPLMLVPEDACEETDGEEDEPEEADRGDV